MSGRVPGARTVLAISSLLAACARGPEPRSPGTAAARRPDAARSPRCDYDVRVRAGTAVLDVSARCTGFAIRGFVADPALLPFTSKVTGADGRRLPRVGSRFTLARTLDARVEYAVDLERAATVLDDFDEALAIGRSVVAPGSSYILSPEPAAPGVPVTVRMHLGPGGNFVTGARGADGGFALTAPEVHHATYGVFGEYDLTRVALPAGADRGPGTLEVAALDGSFAVTKAERLEWVETAARSVAAFYRGFPLARTLLVLAPIPGKDGVVFGKVLPAGGGTVVVLLGAEAKRDALRADWILFHELFHLGFPSFVGEGEWLDEGLATYFEPILRSRAGLLDETAAWSEITRDMPRGVRLCETTGAAHPGDDFRAVYWAGAAIALAADVAARQAPAHVGLEDGVRAVLRRGGDATRVWALGDAIRVIDETLGSPILATLGRAHADRGSPFDLAGLLTSLGVEPAPRGVRLRDDAPLSAIRRAITRGNQEPPPGVSR